MFQPFYVPYWMTVPTAHISVQVAASPLPAGVTLMTSTVGRTTVPRNGVSVVV